jgi:hypothetical protein
MNTEDALMAHLDACLKEGDADFSLTHDVSGWSAVSGKLTGEGETATAAVAALLTALREEPKAKPAKG